MTKSQLSHTIDPEVIREIEKYRDKYHPGASRSYAVERLLRLALKMVLEEEKIRLSVAT